MGRGSKDRRRLDGLDFILRHELTHLKSGHMYLKLLLMGANALHWFNPLIALMQREASVDMELACDESVVRGRDYAFRRAYSETLMSAMEGGCARRIALSTQFYGGKNIMKKRFTQILGKTKEKSGVVLLTAVILLTLSLGTLVGCSEKGFPIDYGHEVRVDVDGDGKAERVWVSDNRDGDNAYTQLLARFDDGREAFINYEGYFNSFLVAGDLSGNGRADVVLVKSDTGSTFGAVEVSVLYFEENRWVEYPYALTANAAIDLEQPEKIYSEDGFGDAYIGATIVQEQDETYLRLITPVDIINAETVECVDAAWEGEHWQIRNVRLVENYYTERRAGDLLENTYEYGMNRKADSEERGTSDGELSDEELCRLSLAYYEAHHEGHIPQVAVVDSVAPDGRVVIHLYDNAEGRSMTCDWYTVDRKTGIGEDVLLEEIRLLE